MKKVYVARLTPVNEEHFDRDNYEQALRDADNTVAPSEHYYAISNCDVMQLPEGWFRDPFARSEAMLALLFGLDVFDAGGQIETQGDLIRIIAEETGMLDELVQERVDKWKDK